MEETVKEMKEFCKRVLRGEAKNLQETAVLPQILELLMTDINKFQELETFDKKIYNSPIYGMQKEEFEFYEQLYKFEQRMFWKGCITVAIIVITILVIVSMLM